MPIFDRNLLRYAFRYVFDLFQGTYSFGTDTTPPVWVNSTCKYMPEWLGDYGFTLIPYVRNSYIVSGVFDVNIIRAGLNAVYADHGNKCQPT